MCSMHLKGHFVMDSFLRLHNVVSAVGDHNADIESTDEIAECGIQKWSALRCYRLN
jgi:hypothetical protein